ncbi:alpha/beta hydrolase [Phaeospirillum tilakii]|uniref:Alpha/beta hydrolase n=1 Tax=Phaeospirillum tilakii TaxID=741673 RepID=A0ABW5CEE2_9PROT
MTNLARLLGILTLGLVGWLSLPATAGAAEVVAEDFFVPSVQSGLDLYLRNKHRDDYADARPERTVLFLHGASYPAHTAFDLAVEGQSWMDWLAQRGYDVYSLDLRGYGKSGRPAEMGQPAESNRPVIDTADAVDDLNRAVDYILSRRGVSRVVLIGWSWGATIAGSYATQVPGRVERLVLYAPQWLRDGPAPTAADLAQVPAWRQIDPNDARDIWLKSVPADRRDAVLPRAVFRDWLKATLATDPAPSAPGTVRAPNGVVLDTMRFWASGKPRWNPEQLSVPTLVIQGEWDAEAPPAMGMALFNRLTHVPFKRYVMVGNATHAALIETNRHQFYSAVQQFLEDRAR